MILTNPHHTNLFEIPVTVSIIGDPELVANKIFNGKKDPKTGKLIIPKSILVENGIECRLKGYDYRNEVDAQQDLFIVFGIIGVITKSSVISNFLYGKLRDFRKIMLVINKRQVAIDSDLIYEHLEQMRS